MGTNDKYISEFSVTFILNAIYEYFKVSADRYNLVDLDPIF